MRPIGPELKLHGDARHHSDREVDGEDFYPKARRLVVTFVAGPERHCFQNDNQQRQPHGELRKKVVKGNRESKMQPIDS